MNDLNNAEYDTLTMLLQTQNISITRTALLKISLVNYLVALILAKTSNISSMTCLMLMVFISLELKWWRWTCLIKRMSDDDYYTLVHSPNEKQWQFFNHVLHSIKIKDDPLRLFLTLSLPQVTKTEFLLTISIQYQAGKWWE